MQELYHQPYVRELCFQLRSPAPTPSATEVGRLWHWVKSISDSQGPWIRVSGLGLRLRVFFVFESLCPSAQVGRRRAQIGQALVPYLQTPCRFFDPASSIKTTLAPHKLHSLHASYSGVPGVPQPREVEGLGFRVQGQGFRTGSLPADPGIGLLGFGTTNSRKSSSKSLWLRASPKSLQLCKRSGLVLEV